MGVYIEERKHVPSATGRKKIGATSSLTFHYIRLWQRRPHGKRQEGHGTVEIATILLDLSR
jgi:hypothetical protein